MDDSHHEGEHGGGDQLRSRLYKLADEQGGHTTRLAEHSVLLGVMSQRLDLLQMTCATQVQLEAAISAFNLKLDAVHGDLKPIKDAITWAVRLVLGAIILAVVAVVLRK